MIFFSEKENFFLFSSMFSYSHPHSLFVEPNFQYIFNLFLFKILLENGANILAKTKRGFCPFELAQMSGDTNSAFCMLLETYLATELFHGIRNNDPEFVKEAISCGASLTRMNHKRLLPFFVAISEGKKEIVKVMIDSGGIDANYGDSAMNVIHFAAIHATPKMILLLLEKGPFYVSAFTKSSNSVPLHFFCRRKFDEEDREDVRKILELFSKVKNGVNIINQKNETALHYACSGHVDQFVIEWLLDHGADPNALTMNYETPLSICIQLRQPTEIQDMLKVLLFFLFSPFFLLSPHFFFAS